MLAAMRERGWSFEEAWCNAIQRFRVQGHMTPDAMEEMIEFKAWFEWSKPIWEWAYSGHAERPELVDGEVFTQAELVTLGSSKRVSRQLSKP